MSLDPFVPWIPVTEAAPGGEGPLAGIRLAIKDVIDMAGFPTGAGHPGWLATHPPADTDADAVARLRAAGAQPVGKNHTDELAYSLAGTNAHYGTPGNPAAPGHLPGGSSSGTASAVAAGRADLGLGTDTAGSIRVPAAYMGLYGLRPSHERVSRAGIIPLAPSFDVPGLLSRDLRTLQTATASLLAGTRAAEAATRLLLPADLWGAVPEQVRDALAPSVAQLLKHLPANRVPLFDEGPARWERTRTAFSTVQGAEAWRAHGAWIHAERPTFGPGVSSRLAAAARVTIAEETEARRSLRQTRELLGLRLFRGAVLAIPSAPGPPPPLGGSGSDRTAILRFTCLAALAGAPAISLPVARIRGLPLGLSLVAAPGAEEELLELAAAMG
jgi:amidase